MDLPSACEAIGFRSFLSQLLACSGKSLIVFQILQAQSFSTVIVTDLLNTQSEGLHLTSFEASWFVSIAYLCWPLGSLVSGFIVGPFGRKKVMQALNVPMFAAWIMIYYANNVATLCVASAIFGMTIGCSQAPAINYIGEVSEPNLRGIMGSFVQISGGFSYFFVYGLASSNSWRATALISSAVPVFTFLALAMIPESPVWFLEKNRPSEAEKSLRWLRGWTKSECIREEFREMEIYCSRRSPYLKSSSSSMSKKVSHFLRREMMQPLSIMILYFGATYASGFLTMLPYISTIFPGLGISQDASQSSVFVAIAAIIGNTSCMLLVRFIGKRVLTLLSLLGAATSTTILALTSLKYLSSDWSFMVFLAFAFFTSVGLVPISWILQSEMYPLDGRGVATGISAASVSVIAFIATNTFLSLQGFLGLTGVLMFYSVMSVLSAVFFYCFLPETEGKTYQQIENHFIKK